MSSSPKTVFQAILQYGHDEDFQALASPEFRPTSAIPGSPEKVDTLRRRVETGQPLWHEGDACDYESQSDFDLDFIDMPAPATFSSVDLMEVEPVEDKSVSISDENKREPVVGNGREQRTTSDSQKSRRSSSKKRAGTQSSPESPKTGREGDASAKTADKGEKGAKTDTAAKPVESTNRSKQEKQQSPPRERRPSPAVASSVPQPIHEERDRRKEVDSYMKQLDRDEFGADFRSVDLNDKELVAQLETRGYFKLLEEKVYEQARKAKADLRQREESLVGAGM